MSAKILLIDDEKIISVAISKLLVKEGYEVEVCHSGAEGLKKIESTKFDLVLLDIEMPEMSGLEVLNKVRESTEKNFLPIIMVSSLESDKTIVDALKCGANDYVTKPIRNDILNARITTQLELRKLALEFANKKEIEALNAMITTYNHEINNPLTISFGMLDKMMRDEKYEPDIAEKLKNSLVRIKDIVQKIKTVTEKSNVSYDDYVKDSKMLKV